MSRPCEICKVPMYESSNGGYQCRNFDCPPGNEKAHQRSWKISKQLRPILLKQIPNGLTIEEIGLVLHESAQKEYGPALEAIANKLGIEVTSEQA